MLNLSSPLVSQWINDSFRSRTLCQTAAFASLIAAVGCQTPPRAAPPERPLIVTTQDDFELADISDAWSMRTPSLWRIAVEGDRKFLQMALPPQRPFMPGIRRPQEYALCNRYEWRSFNLSCRVRIDRPVATQGRDVCILLGRQDATHLYYVHLSSLSADVHNNIVCVNGDQRRVLIPKAQQPPPAITDANWHKVDVIRDCDTGRIQVFVDAHDESVKPVFDVIDRTYEWGMLGLGSFDDHGSFDHVIIDGQARALTRPVDVDAP